MVSASSVALAGLPDLTGELSDLTGGEPSGPAVVALSERTAAPAFDLALGLAIDVLFELTAGGSELTVGGPLELTIDGLSELAVVAPSDVTLGVASSPAVDVPSDVAMGERINPTANTPSPIAVAGKAHFAQLGSADQPVGRTVARLDTGDGFAAVEACSDSGSGSDGDSGGGPLPTEEAAP